MLTCMPGPKLVLFTIMLCGLSTASALCKCFVKGHSWVSSISILKACINAGASPNLQNERHMLEPSRVFFFSTFFFDV